jgi:VCBS repeat-containing protein
VITGTSTGQVVEKGIVAWESLDFIPGTADLDFVITGLTADGTVTGAGSFGFVWKDGEYLLQLDSQIMGITEDGRILANVAVGTELISNMYFIEEHARTFTAVSRLKEVIEARLYDPSLSPDAPGSVVVQARPSAELALPGIALSGWFREIISPEEAAAYDSRRFDLRGAAVNDAGDIAGVVRYLANGQAPTVPDTPFSFYQATHDGQFPFNFPELVFVVQDGVYREILVRPEGFLVGPADRVAPQDDDGFIRLQVPRVLDVDVVGIDAAGNVAGNSRGTAYGVGFERLAFVIQADGTQAFLAPPGFNRGDTFITHLSEAGVVTGTVRNGSGSHFSFTYDIATGDYEVFDGTNLADIQLPVYGGASFDGVLYAADGDTGAGMVVIDGERFAFGTFESWPLTVTQAEADGLIAGTTWNRGSGVQAFVGDLRLPVARAEGDLDAVDAAGAAVAFVAASGTSALGLGSWSIDADGDWGYLLDDANAALAALTEGERLLDSFVATTVDGTTQTITIDVFGARENDQLFA